MATIEVTAADDDTVIAAEAGDTIAVRLPDNPATGYRWELEPVTGGAVVLDDAGYEPSSDAVGGGGVATWTLHAAASGTASIRLKRWRPWEGDGSVRARFRVTVNVRG